MYKYINSNYLANYFSKKNIIFTESEEEEIIFNSEKLLLDEKIKLLKNEKLKSELKKLIAMFKFEEKAFYQLSRVVDEEGYRYYVDMCFIENLSEVSKKIEHEKDCFLITKYFFNSNKRIRVIINNEGEYIHIDSYNIVSYKDILKPTKINFSNIPFEVGDIIYRKLSFRNDTKMTCVISKIKDDLIEVTGVESDFYTNKIMSYTVSNIFDYELCENDDNHILITCLSKYLKGSIELTEFLSVYDQYKNIN